MGGRGRQRGISPSTPPPTSGESKAAKEAELAKLGETLKSLRQQLADTITRIEELEKEN
jgi:hypothetical protein